MRYCIGDIHGCYKTFQNLISQILESDREAKFYLLGDLIDRGPASKQVLDLIIDLYDKKTILGIVRGNHEQMLIEAFNDDISLEKTLWYVNGAFTTLNEFNESYSSKQKLKEILPFNYFSFINSLPFYIELDDYFIVHAGFNFRTDKPFSDYESMIWMRGMEYNHLKLKNKKVIHGHTPILYTDCEKSLKQKIINIDTGCVFTQYKGFGYLSALNIDTMELYSIYNIEK